MTHFVCWSWMMPGIVMLRVACLRRCRG